MEIQNLVDKTEYPIEVIMSKLRDRDVCVVRQVLIYLLHKQGFTSTKVGQIMNRDHATVLYSIIKVRDMIELKDPATMRYINLFKEEA